MSKIVWKRNNYDQKLFDEFYNYCKYHNLVKYEYLINSNYINTQNDLINECFEKNINIVDDNQLEEYYHSIGTNIQDSKDFYANMIYNNQLDEYDIIS